MAFGDRVVAWWDNVTGDTARETIARKPRWTPPTVEDPRQSYDVVDADLARMGYDRHGMNPDEYGYIRQAYEQLLPEWQSGARGRVRGQPAGSRGTGESAQVVRQRADDLAAQDAAAYIDSLYRELGLSAPADLRSQQYAALYDQGDRMLSAAGVSAAQRGLRGGGAVEGERERIVRQRLAPAAAQIESAYAGLLADSDQRRLGLARQYRYDRRGLADQAMRFASEDDWRRRQYNSGLGWQAYQTNVIDPYEAQLASQLGAQQFWQGLGGSAVGTGMQVGGAWALPQRQQTGT